MINNIQLFSFFLFNKRKEKLYCNHITLYFKHINNTPQYIKDILEINVRIHQKHITKSSTLICFILYMETFYCRIPLLTHNAISLEFNDEMLALVTKCMNRIHMYEFSQQKVSLADLAPIANFIGTWSIIHNSLVT